ncbi:MULTISPECIES: sugar phosphate isomerase/epimerase family protein [unclassified Rhizobium]|uniref:sugar phosphate isomerase/epimerase family protein n=1 Tax=unclassified Rhizobium TaxID=2613769 RepID=UPI001ADA8543|nr:MULTISPECIES: sugar phosphate isomerase/epimerase [unclassified Rhizobium]MBO9127751.1 TIM barrel protein [Rhizobium sp. 16-488-2b]MBO9178213.1 TIM barrel protein [Rhizobium sp. 16-488-2a]
MTIRIAYNPLSFSMTEDGYKPEITPPLPTILAAVSAAGYDGIHAEIPADITPHTYKAMLGDYGLSPAPGYFSANFADEVAVADALERARRIGSAHAKLGLDRIFFADRFGAIPERIVTPAQGVASDRETSLLAASNMERVARVLVAEGVVPCLHPHIGSRVETQGDAELVLDNVPPDLLMFGPDTGHLAWAGADMVEMFTRYAGRIGAVHVKDYHKAVADEVKALGETYDDAVRKHIWTEPGRGNIDLNSPLQAIAGFDGWMVVEVDLADQPTVEQSAKISIDWLRSHLAAATGQRH